MTDHAARDHATWSASATARNWECPGALALTMDLPEGTNEAADWGTACHQISEKCLRQNVDTVSFIGTTEKGKKHEFEVDEEMAETAQTYVDFVREQAALPDAVLHIEQAFSLASLNPPFDAGGTADAVVYVPGEKLLHVIDLKGGKGVVVEAKGNPQLRTYALGAMLANTGLPINTIRSTIVQPRAGHKDGRIRSEDFHVADLVDWTTELLAAMRKSENALSATPNRSTTRVQDVSWWTTFLNAGSHCKFCKAAGFCPALEQKALDAAGVWFDDLDQPRISNSPDAMSTEKLAQTLDSLDMIGEWMNAVRAYAHEQAESGVEIPGYQLVDKIGNRAWKAAEPTVIGVLFAQDINPYTKKLMSPAQAEKALGAQRKHLLDKLVERPVRGTNLVAVNKTTRSAAKPAVHKHFDILE
jgi:hypothetical protein